MSNCFLKILYALGLLLLHFAGFILGFNWDKSAEIKCVERERQALLKFKQGLQEDFGMLSTWRDDENNGDCCKWQGIECNNETGHIHMLDLHGHGTHYLIGAINIISLVELKNMEYLDLSYSDFRGTHIPEFLGSLTKLRYLNLSSSGVVGRIPYQLGKLTHLQYLDLSKNHYIHGEVPCQLGNLSQLQHLDLGGTSLSGEIPFLKGNLPMLHTVKLVGNFDLTINGVEWLSTLPFLTNLALNGSFFHFGSSHHWLQMISKLIPNLRELRLVSCGLLDNDISSLFHSHSNFSTSLTILDLSYNMLTWSTFQFLSNFSLNLQELYISHNNIVLSSPPYPNFPSLVILDLSHNNLTSSKFQGNFNFSSKLQKLNLQNCSLMDRSFFVSSTSTVNSSSSLVVLDLSYNLLKSSAIFHWLFNFTTNLRDIYLDDNLLEGPIPCGFEKVMNSLELLDISYNKLQGEIPTFFGNMCTLQRLDLSNNRIIGNVPESIRLLSKLEYLSLEGNILEGDITESHLNNFSKLKYLYLSHNSLSLKFAPSWVPPFQLLELQVASCKLGPSFPRWLQTERFLSYLDISNAGLNDSVPKWFWSNLQYIGEMNMSHNNLQGEIPNLPFKLPYGPSIFLNSNQFDGAVPSFLLQASDLMLSENNFWDLFSFLCNKSPDAKLVTLDLSNNQIKGQLPDCWKSVSKLLFLDLRNNKLAGKVPLSMGTLVKLEALVLRNNSLMGELPSTLKNCGNLMLLDVGENMLSGPIPSWIGESMQQLIILSMKVNRFSGNIPFHLCYLRHIQLLDLSRNNLSKGIPICFKNFTAMSKKNINSSEILSHLYWYNNTYWDIYDDDNYGLYKLDVTLMWKGVEYGFKDPELQLKSIDLSSNNFIGEIPKEIGYLLGLVSLNFSRNNLSGEIPSEIGNLSSLEFLDLSRNDLSGKIPSSLSQIDRLAVLDLANNSLYGKIPLGRQLQTFDASDFEGNLDLCGIPLDKICPEDETSMQPQGSTGHEIDENSVFFEALYLSMGLGYFTGFWGLIGSILLWRPWRIAYLRFLNKLTNYIYVMVAVNMARWQR